MATTKRRTAASSNGTGNASFSEILAQVDDRSQFINRAINSYLQRAAAAATKEGEGGELGIKTSTTTNAPSYVECAIDHAAFKNIISSGVCIDKADEAPMVK